MLTVHTVDSSTKKTRQITQLTITGVQGMRRMKSGSLKRLRAPIHRPETASNLMEEGEALMVAAAVEDMLKGEE